MVNPHDWIWRAHWYSFASRGLVISDIHITRWSFIREIFWSEKSARCFVLLRDWLFAIWLEQTYILKGLTLHGNQVLLMLRLRKKGTLCIPHGSHCSFLWSSLQMVVVHKILATTTSDLQFVCLHTILILALLFATEPTMIIGSGLGTLATSEVLACFAGPSL